MIDKYKFYSRFFFGLFWAVTCWGFVSEEIIPPLDKLETPFLLLTEALLMVLGVMTLRQRNDIYVIISYLVIGIITTFYIHHLGIVYFLNGTRDFLPSLFCIPIIRWFMQSEYRTEFRSQMDKFLKIWLILQAFCLIWQLIRYGANDHGGGTYGDGGSGMVSTFIYIVSFYFVSKTWDKTQILKSFRENWLYIILLFPSFLNETKISFVYLTLYFLLLLNYDKMMLIRAFILFPIAILVGSVAFSVYLDTTGQKGEDILSIDFLDHYLISGGEDLAYEVEMAQMWQDGVFDDAMDEGTWWMIDLPRFAKLIIVPPILADQPGGLWWGAGIGTLKAGRTLPQTSFSKKNNWALAGTRVWYLFLLIECGVMGVIWWSWAFWRIVFRRGLYGNFAQRKFIQLILIFFLILFYSDFLRIMAPFFMFTYFFFDVHTPDNDADEQRSNFPIYLPAISK